MYQEFNVCLVVDDNFLCGGENDLFFKDPFLLVFLATKHSMEKMRLFIWLFFFIFSAFLFDFLGYQMQSSKVITFFVNFFGKKKEPKKKKTLLCC